MHSITFSIICFQSPAPFQSHQQSGASRSGSWLCKSLLLRLGVHFGFRVAGHLFYEKQQNKIFFSNAYLAQNWSRASDFLSTCRDTGPFALPPLTSAHYSYALCTALISVLQSINIAFISPYSGEESWSSDKRHKKCRLPRDFSNPSRCLAL